VGAQQRQRFFFFVFLQLERKKKKHESEKKKKKKKRGRLNLEASHGTIGDPTLNWRPDSLFWQMKKERAKWMIKKQLFFLNSS
jgi:hypothetical protein